ncbi:hypothetical protein SAMN05444920_12023 [Nonomuraea solani]|uniref:Uncharacterized protein n=1 Tax=Nonomuraea solani TaxID=1144553 RepID=A0A1H6EWR7_9ACTN|nr:hypothetical protein SAMN05444920_12023 [Nonomuraea solani]
MLAKNLITPAGKRQGENPSLAGIHRALAEHEKTQAHADFVLLQGQDARPASDGRANRLAVHQGDAVYLAAGDTFGSGGPNSMSRMARNAS